ncbi:DDE-type integrase/transposase/recombinase [Sabulilitoribacter arenilitoris]|uniref:DDE-type integrase/transposase/recombinase n=1 Tax=Wocania arenilitoris TaxID=2044858 RepID=A0AAE3ENR5_9FLAO|nr:DDE-type integrase/transposase/recombinase [Wocania arenilitoris]
MRTAQGWLYLTNVIDLYDRQVVGWSLSDTLYAKDTILAWKMAISKREITENLIFHSDRGVQYASNAFRDCIKTNKLITQSMSRKDLRLRIKTKILLLKSNAVAESFFKNLKKNIFVMNDTRPNNKPN